MKILVVTNSVGSSTSLSAKKGLRRQAFVVDGDTNPKKVENYFFSDSFFTVPPVFDSINFCG
jgi:hypothetical protein